MTPDVKRFLIFSLKAIVVIFITDVMVGESLSILYDRMTIGEKARSTYLLKKDTSEVVVFGSSRALYHYHSQVLADSLGMTVYNAGRSNQGILYDVAILKTIVKRHHPTLAILDISEDELVPSSKKYEMVSALLPYYRYDDDIAEVYDAAKPGYRYWSWSRTLPYNSSVFATVYRGLKPGGKKDKDIRGFLHREGILHEKLKTLTNCTTDATTDPLLSHAFEEFVNTCRVNNIKLFVAISPRYLRYACERPELGQLVALARSSGVTVHNYADIPLESIRFSDPAHLNSSGAIEYSQIVVPDLRKALE